MATSISESQYRMLRDLTLPNASVTNDNVTVVWRDDITGDHRPNRCSYRSATFHALLRRGLIARRNDDSGEHVVTDAGKVAFNQYSEAHNGHFTFDELRASRIDMLNRYRSRLFPERAMEKDVDK
jgi:uncharacterized protein (DUF1684 family)